jgi:hypothetical protein
MEPDYPVVLSADVGATADFHGLRLRSSLYLHLPPANMNHGSSSAPGRMVQAQVSTCHLKSRSAPQYSVWLAFHGLRLHPSIS